MLICVKDKPAGILYQGPVVFSFPFRAEIKIPEITERHIYLPANPDRSERRRRDLSIFYLIANFSRPSGGQRVIKISIWKIFRLRLMLNSEIAQKEFIFVKRLEERQSFPGRHSKTIIKTGELLKSPQSNHWE